MNDNPNGEDLEEKKLLGSGDYVYAKLTEHLNFKTSILFPSISLEVNDVIKIYLLGYLILLIG
jgi:hypothetical protein